MNKIEKLLDYNGKASKSEFEVDEHCKYFSHGIIPVVNGAKTKMIGIGETKGKKCKKRA